MTTMPLRGVALSLVVFGTVVAAVSCGGTAVGTDGSGGADTGGSASTGGKAGAGGGKSATGGRTGTGGTPATGGNTATGGSPGSGGGNGCGAGDGCAPFVPLDSARMCAPMDARERPDAPCPRIGPAYAWDGRKCLPITCCEGTDCSARYLDIDACDRAHSACYENARVHNGCERNADCTVSNRSCCFCGETTPTSVLAISSSSSESLDRFVCDGLGTCPPCVSIANPALSAICFESECKLLDLTPFDECETSADCVLQERTCCGECATLAEDFVSVNVTSVEGYKKEVCMPSARARCEPRACQPPGGISAACNQGRCVVGPLR